MSDNGSPSTIEGGGEEEKLLLKECSKSMAKSKKKQSVGAAKKTIVKREIKADKVELSKSVEDEDHQYQKEGGFAGRSRREKEKNAFLALSAMLPLAPPIRDQLDKSGALRVATTFLKLHRLFRTISNNNPEEFYSAHGEAKQQQNAEAMYQFAYNLFQAMDGFVIVLDSLGKVVYVSETVAVHLGLSQIELTGHALGDFLHPEADAQLLCDRCALGVRADVLRVVAPLVRFTLRFRCAPGRRAMQGCSVGGIGAQPGHKPIHFAGTLHADEDGRFIGWGQPTVAYGLNELRLSPSMFMFRAMPSLHLIFVDNCFIDLLGFSADALLDNSLYQFVHPSDVENLEEAHQTALQQGQSLSSFFRVLAAAGGWAWVQARLCAVSSSLRLPSTAHQPMLVGVCSLISDVEHPSLAQDIKQLNVQQNHSSEEQTKREECGSLLGFYSNKYYGTKTK